MKTSKNNLKRLALSRETLRPISNAALAGAAGGVSVSEPTTHYTETTKSSNQSTNWSTTWVTGPCTK